jgi:23S rRNA pseudouridine2605 synthase
MQERLQKIIARAGIASRRHAEELIKSGLVTVNGNTITELGTKADEATDHIKVSGKLLHPETDRVYMVLNKPAEVVSTMSDPEGRRALSDLLHGVKQRVFPVGRLEYHAMGLVFLTNDGELANAMLKSHHLPQTYELKLKSLLTFQETENFARVTGAHISRQKGREAPWYEVTISDARRDALRNRLFQTGHPVEKTKRIKIGNVALGSLGPGEHRELSSAELTTLRKSLVDTSGPAMPAGDFEDVQVPSQEVHTRTQFAPTRPQARPQAQRWSGGPKRFGRPSGTPRTEGGDSRPSFGKRSFGEKKVGDKKFGDKRFSGNKFGSNRPAGPGRPFDRERPFNSGGGPRGDRPASSGRPWERKGSPQGEGRSGFSKPSGSQGPRSFGSGAKNFSSDRPRREGQSFGGDKSFRDKKSFGGGSAADRPFNSGKSFRPGQGGQGSRPPQQGGGGKSFGRPGQGGPGNRPPQQGGFGKPSSPGKYSKGPRPGGARGPKRSGPGGPKRSGPGGPRPSSGNFRGGPRNSR